MKNPGRYLGLKFLRVIFTLCRGVFWLHVCMCTEKCLVPEEATGMMVLELQAVVSCHMGTRNRTGSSSRAASNLAV